ncbi:MAG: tetratricopeptide repeat protein [Bacteroidetes bacterium]|nr:tetratricopeptide repeat protein [Bacteroidota bacterium]
MKILCVFFISLFLLSGIDGSALSTRKKKNINTSSYGSDTAHIIALTDSGFILAGSNSNLAAFYSLRALHLAEKINYRKGIGSARYSLGNLELLHGNYEKAVFQFNLSYKIFEEMNDVRRAATAKGSIATVYSYQGKYEEALNQLFQALKILEKKKDFKRAGAILINIGGVFQKTYDYTRAKYYFRQALLFVGENSHVSINTIYTNLGGVFAEENNYDSSLFYYRKALNYFEKSKTNKYAQAFTLIEMSKIYGQVKEYDNSLAMIMQALPICNAMGFTVLKAKCLTEFAETYCFTGQYDKAILFANQALEITRTGKLLELESSNFEILYLTYKKMNLTSLALHNLEELKIVKDSLLKTNKMEELHRMDSKYLTEKLEQKELILKQQSDLYKTRQIQFYLILTLVFFFLVFVSIVFYVKQQASRRKTKILEQETEINKQKVIIHQQETALYEAELNKQKNEILAISTLHGKTNEALLQIINDLRQLAFQEIKNKAVSDTLYKLAGNIEKVSTTDSWSDFRKWFTDIHPHFYENLTRICPSLTSNDLKLASLLRMNLSSKEIASLSMRSLDSIHIAKHRLRKKLGLEDDNTLINFLFSVPS